MNAEELLQEPVMGLIKHPARVLIVGKSQSGKTTRGVKLVKKLAKEVKEVIVVSKTFQLQDTWDDVRDKVTLWHDSPDAVFKTLNSKIKDELGDEDRKIGKLNTSRLLVIDDVSDERATNAGSKGVFSGFIYNSVWYNMSIVSICHKMAVISPAMRENAEFVLLFNQTNPKEKEHLFENFGSIARNKKQFMELFDKEIWENVSSGQDPYAFLTLDLRAHGGVYYGMKEKLELPPIE